MGLVTELGKAKQEQAQDQTAMSALVEAIMSNPEAAAMLAAQLGQLAGDTTDTGSTEPTSEAASDYAEWLDKNFDDEVLETLAYNARTTDLGGWATGSANSFGKETFAWNKQARGHSLTVRELVMALANEMGKYHPDYDGAPSETEPKAEAKAESDNGTTVLGAQPEPTPEPTPEPEQRTSGLTGKRAERLDAALDALDGAEHVVKFGDMTVTVSSNPMEWVREGNGDRRYLPAKRRYELTAAFAPYMVGEDAVDGDELSLALGDALGLNNPASATSERPQGYNHALSGYRTVDQWLEAAADALS